MHPDPVGLRRRAHAQTVFPSIVTQLIRYYPPPEVFHSGSGHNNVIRLLVKVEKFNRDMSTVHFPLVGKSGNETKQKSGKSPQRPRRLPLQSLLARARARRRKRSAKQRRGKSLLRPPKSRSFRSSINRILEFQDRKNPRNPRSPGRSQMTLRPPVPQRLIDRATRSPRMQRVTMDSRSHSPRSSSCRRTRQPPTSSQRSREARPPWRARQSRCNASSSWRRRCWSHRETQPRPSTRTLRS
jgi:hypothetical protein